MGATISYYWYGTSEHAVNHNISESIEKDDTESSKETNEIEKSGIKDIKDIKEISNDLIEDIPIVNNRDTYELNKLRCCSQGPLGNNSTDMYDTDSVGNNSACIDEKDNYGVNVDDNQTQTEIIILENGKSIQTETEILELK